MINRATLERALKGRTAYATVMATDGFEVRMTHAEAEELRRYTGGNIGWWVSGDSITIEAYTDKNYGGVGDLTGDI